MQLKPKRLETQRKSTSSKPPILDDNHNIQQTPIHNQDHPFFPIGSQVEVSSDEEGFKGAWFLATVLKPPSSSLNNNKILVEYNNLLAEENGSSLLTEYVDVEFVRPRPPVDEVSYKVNDVVDAYYQDGWWCGVVTQVVEPNSKYTVFFSNPPDEQIFGPSDLRLHKSWVHGNWLLPHNQRMGELNFTPGTAVEVNIDPDCSRDVWFPATFVKLLSDNSFLVEYRSSSVTGLQKVAVNSHHIRPSPPATSIKTFSLLEKVDAFCDCCWLSGIVTKILADGRYIVYFKQTKKEKELLYSELRLHMDWTNDKWVHSSQDKSTTSKLDKSLGSTNGGYKEKIRASADSGVMKGNVGQGRISAVTLQSSLNNSQTPGNDQVNHKSVMPSNKRTKQASTNGDTIILRFSRSSNEEVASDAPLSPVTSKPQVKQTEVLDCGIAVDLDTSTPVEQGKSSLEQSEDSRQPSDSTKIKGGNEKDPVTRKRGRPRKLQASVSDTIEKTPTLSDSVKLPGSIVIGLTYNGRMIESLAESSGQLLNMKQATIDEEGKQLATSADHHESIESGRQKEVEVTNLKRKRGRPHKVLFRLGNPETREAVPESVDSAEKVRQVVIDLESSVERPLVNEVEKPIVAVEPPAICDSTPSTDSGPRRTRIINDHFKRLCDVRKVGQRRTARQPVRKHRKVLIAAAMEPANAFILRGKKLRSVRQAEFTSADAGDKSSGTVAGDPDNVIGGDIDKAVPVILSTASDDDKPLSAWLEGAHSPLATDGSKLQSDGTSERRDENRTPSVGQFKEKVPEENVDTSAGNASQYNDFPKSQDETQTKSAAVVPRETPTKSVAVVPRETLTKSTAIVPRETPRPCTAIVSRENQDLPFVKNSPVWGMIESMGVLQRIPQKPHFLPLFNCKEECREGIAIGSMVTFTSLAEKISKTCFDDPKSLLEGYLEALVDLEELGFNVIPLRELLNKLFSIKDRHEQAQNTAKEIENQIMEKNDEKSKMDEEIADLEKKIAELKGKHALAVSKKEKREAEIKLLQSSVDGVKGALDKAREEFEKVTTSLC